MSTTDDPWIDFSSTMPCDKDKKYSKPRGNGKCKGKKCKKPKRDSSEFPGGKKTWSTTFDPVETTENYIKCATIEGALDPNNPCSCFNDQLERCPLQCNVIDDECVELDTSQKAMRTDKNAYVGMDALEQHNYKEPRGTKEHMALVG